VLTALSSALQTLGTDFAALPNAIATTQAGGGGSSGGSCTAGVEMTFARSRDAGTIQATAAVSGIGVPYVVRFTYGS
jgi:hypothetical protein